MDRKSRLVLMLCGASGFLAVAAGAFGAHGVADPRAKAWLETGGHYQLIHAVAAMACWLSWRQGVRHALLPAWLFLAGALIFAGSLYLMAAGGPLMLGAVTPIGGLLLLMGWAALAFSVLARPGEGDN